MVIITPMFQYGAFRNYESRKQHSRSLATAEGGGAGSRYPQICALTPLQKSLTNIILATIILRYA